MFYYEIKLEKFNNDCEIYLKLDGDIKFDLYLYDGKNKDLIEKNVETDRVELKYNLIKKYKNKSFLLFDNVVGGAKFKDLKIIQKDYKKKNIYFENSGVSPKQFDEGILLNENENLVYDLGKLSFYDCEIEISSIDDYIFINDEKETLQYQNLSDKEIIAQIFKKFDIINCKVDSETHKTYKIRYFGIFDKLKFKGKGEILNLNIKSIDFGKKIKLEKNKKYIIEGITDKEKIKINDIEYNVKNNSFYTEGKYYSYKFSFTAKIENTFENCGVYKFNEETKSSYIKSSTINNIESGFIKTKNKEFEINYNYDKEPEIILNNNLGKRIVITDKNLTNCKCKILDNFEDELLVTYMLLS